MRKSSVFRTCELSGSVVDFKRLVETHREELLLALQLETASNLYELSRRRMSAGASFASESIVQRNGSGARCFWRPLRRAIR